MTAHIKLDVCCHVDILNVTELAAGYITCWAYASLIRIFQVRMSLMMRFYGRH